MTEIKETRVGRLPTAPSGKGAQNAHPTALATGRCLDGLV